LRKIGINNFKLTLIYMGFCGLMFILFRNVLPHFFTKESDVLVINLASKLMIIAALFQLSDGIQVTALGCLRGIQDVKIPSVITFLAYWVFTIPVGYFLCDFENGSFWDVDCVGNRIDDFCDSFGN
jgi:MATE family multidrug resistance protein